jgi:peptide/nickel transport system substrate-binding protein
MKINLTILSLFIFAFAVLVTGCGPEDLPSEEGGVILPGTSENSPTPLPHATGVPAATPSPTDIPSETAVPETPDVDNGQEPDEPQLLWTQQLKQAIAAAIDREALVDRVFEGRRTPAYFIIPPDFRHTSEPFFDKYGTRDLDRSARLLRELGYSQEMPFELDLWYSESWQSPLFTNLLEVIQQQLEESGLIVVHLRLEEDSLFQENVEKAQMPFFISRRTSIFADPENWLSPLASCDQSSVQGIFFCDPQLDVLIDQSAQTANPDVRNQVYEQIGEIYAEDVPVIPIFWDAEFLVKRAGIQIEPAAPGSLLNFSTIQLDENILTASGRPDTLVIGTTMLPEVLNPYEAAHPNEF